MVPVEDLKLLEALENKMDLEAARSALKKRDEYHGRSSDRAWPS